MRWCSCVLTLVALVGVISAPIQAAVTDYSGDEAGFDAAVSGRSVTAITFDDLAQDDLITTQYAPQNAHFLTRAGGSITVRPTAHGPAARSAPLCAEVEFSDQVLDFFTIDFLQPVWGAEVYVADVNVYVTVDVLDATDGLLASYQVARTGDWTHVAVLSDAADIGRLTITPSTVGDGIGFDDVLIVPRTAAPMVFIPGGTFEMGDHHDGMSFAVPVHPVTLDAFWLSQYEVRNDQYANFLNAAQIAGHLSVTEGVVYGWGQPLCETTASLEYSRITYSEGVFGVVGGKEDHPMVCVSWYGAKAFCDWYGYRLPTEAEWEYAARGGEYLPYFRYPWGDAIDGSMANYGGSGDPFETGPQPWTTPVGYYMPNGYGLYDMAGNAWEWCSDWYDPSYYVVSPVYDPAGPLAGVERSIRSGGWLNPTSDQRCAYRHGYEPDLKHNSTLGFRVAWSPQLVSVPAGAFAYQNATDPNDWVWLRSFEIGKYEVTNAEYCLFLNAADPDGNHWDASQDITQTGPVPPYSYAVQSDRDGYPIRYVSAIDAEAYCDWLSSVSGDTYRLPTEQEWEKAAGWDADPNVPNPNPGPLWTYGLQNDTIDSSWCNIDNWYSGEPTPVGWFDGTDGRNDAKSYYDAYDMCGNLYEWTSSMFSVTERVVRGGDSDNNAAHAQVTSRTGNVLSARTDNGGFRVVRDVAPTLVSSDPPMDGTLSTAANNVISLTFSKAITLPVGVPVSITPIAGGPDRAGAFSYSIEPDGVTLKITENGEVLNNLTWYRIQPVEGFDVMPFVLDVCTLRGDADGNGQVLAADLGRIWSHNAEMTDGRYDINGDGQVLAADLGLAWSFNAWSSPAKNVLPAKPAA